MFPSILLLFPSLMAMMVIGFVGEVLGVGSWIVGGGVVVVVVVVVVRIVVGVLIVGVVEVVVVVIVGTYIEVV